MNPVRFFQGGDLTINARQCHIEINIRVILRASPPFPQAHIDNAVKLVGEYFRIAPNLCESL